MSYYYKLGDQGQVVEILVYDGDQPPVGYTLSDIPLDNHIWYYQQGSLNKAAPQPSPSYIFDYELKQWVDRRTLDQIKAACWSSIKLAREAAITAPLVTPYGTFDATPDAQKSITDAVLMLQTLAAMGTPQTIDYTLADNTTATLTTEQMVAVGLMLGAQTQAAYARARTLRAQIDTATSAAEIAAIAWS